jgi:tRNA modification GTPase
MTVLAAVMTGPGAGAIATIQLLGDSVPTVLQQMFVPSGSKPAGFETGRVLLGHIADVDQVTIGCEAPQAFGIHCHGNPLIVETVVKRLQSLGVQIVSARRLLSLTWRAQDPLGSIPVEAGLALTTTKTVAGAVLIHNQVHEGLAATALQWQQQLGSSSLERIGREAGNVLADSRAARLIIEGCVIALIGPPNAGKSTLLNALAGREKAIVTDVRGTTRDWVSADIHIPPLAATLIDTAGLDAALAAEGAVARAAQEKSVEVLHQADLALLVLDGSCPEDQVGADTLEVLSQKAVVVVLNKSDLPLRFSSSTLPNRFRRMVRVSAKQGAGIAELIAAIHQASGVAGFDPHSPVAFTSRQRTVLGALSSAASVEQARGLVADLLHGDVPC